MVAGGFRSWDNRLCMRYVLKRIRRYSVRYGKYAEEGEGVY
jgi:hypothetical protein